MEGASKFFVQGERLGMIISNSLAMAFAWILLFGTKCRGGKIVVFGGKICGNNWEDR
jgi:hypothetical protein